MGPLSVHRAALEERRSLAVSLTLRNQNEPKKTLSLSYDTWFALLEMAEEYGWNPRGTTLPGFWMEWEPDPAGCETFDLYAGQGDYTADNGLVVIEDALNLADALERAFLDYEPGTNGDEQAAFSAFSGPASRLRPSIGAMSMVTDFCRNGSFWIERS